MIKIKINPEEKDSNIKAKLNIRKAVDGSLIIADHEDIDIVVIPKSMKILLLPNELMDDKVYDTQNRLMKILIKDGVIEPESVHSGNVYASLEAKIKEPAEEIKVNPVDLAILEIARFIEEEKPYFMYSKASEEQEEERLLDPDEEESTELGEVPHGTKKGTIQPKMYPTLPHSPSVRENKGS
jgi:hypothetical protein